jgi:hypothetical protein
MFAQPSYAQRRCHAHYTARASSPPVPRTRALICQRARRPTDDRSTNWPAQATASAPSVRPHDPARRPSARSATCKMACRPGPHISLNPARSDKRSASAHRLRPVAWEHMFAASMFRLSAALRRAGAWLRAFAFLDDAPVPVPTPPRRPTRERANHRRLGPPARPSARSAHDIGVEYRRLSVGATPQPCVTAAAARCSGAFARDTTDLDEQPAGDDHRHHVDPFFQLP